MGTVSSPPCWSARMRRGSGSASTKGVSGALSDGPTMPGHLLLLGLVRRPGPVGPDPGDHGSVPGAAGGDNRSTPAEPPRAGAQEGGDGQDDQRFHFSSWIMARAAATTARLTHPAGVSWPMLTVAGKIRPTEATVRPRVKAGTSGTRRGRWARRE